MNEPLRIVIGSDDAGYDYKTILKGIFERDDRVAKVVDVGISPDQAADYPEAAVVAARRIAAGDSDRGLPFCGSGLGVAMAANKVAGIRAVTAHDSYSVARSVLSNDARVLTTGPRVIGIELAKHVVSEWLDYRFDPSSASAAKVAAIGTDEDEAAAAERPSIEDGNRA